MDNETTDEILEGLGYLYGATGHDIDENALAGFGDPMTLGIFKKIARGVKKGVRTAARTAKAGVKAAVSVYAMPFKLLLQLLTKAILPLARAICKVPMPALQVAAASAVVDPMKVPLFCKAVSARNWNEVRRLLPEIIKLSVKLAATTAVPGLGPALLVLKNVPGIKKFVSFAGSDTGGGISDPIEMLDSVPYDALFGAAFGLTDEELADGLGAVTGRQAATGALLVTGVLATGLGLYGALRKPKLSLPVI